MGEARAPNNELALIDYQAGMKYKDIAEKYGVTINTVKSWKTRYEWTKGDKKGVHTKSKKVCTQKQKRFIKTKAVAEEVGLVLENPDLTDKQRLFCIYYSKSFNATKSYQKAYECSYITACTSGPRLLENVRVKEEILRLKEMAYSKAFLKTEDIFQKYLDIAFSDVTDYLSFGREEVPVITKDGPVLDTKTGEPMTKEVNYVKFKESSEIDGRLIKKVKMGKDGATIELYDAMDAMNWLYDNMSLGTSEQQNFAKSIIEAHRKRKEEAEREGAEEAGT